MCIRPARELWVQDPKGSEFGYNIIMGISINMETAEYLPHLLGCKRAQWRQLQLGALHP